MFNRQVLMDSSAAAAGGYLLRPAGLNGFACRHFVAVLCTWLFARFAIYNTADSSEIHPKKRPISMKMSSKEKHGRFIF
jgi:hypothetical protein